jgi:cellobiose transport system substrate-binding protein
VGTNPDIKAAYDLTVEMIQSDLSAKLAPFTPEWTSGFAQGSFATVACPAWMTNYIQDNAKDASGKWDIATVPGGSGSAGGSFLTAPKQGKNAAMAAELIKFLTAPEQQAKVFRETGNFPSSPKLYEDPAIRDLKKEYFNNAPMGLIFSEAALALKPQYLGPKEGDVMTAIGQGLGRFEDGSQDAQQAWDQVLRDVEKLR